MLVALQEGVKGNKWFSLIDKVSRLGVLELAWAKVQSNAGACGVDGITVERFEKDSQKRLLAVSEQIQRGTYQPQPVKRVWIPKPGSAEQRPLGIPTVRDRVVQTAMRMVIEPIFEREFAEESYGFRPGRSCQDALRRVDELLKSGHGHVVDLDIRGYFDAIPHGRLMAEVEKHIADGRVLGLIEAFLKAEVMEEMVNWEVESGTPQGGVISPLLANIYLNPLDWKLAQDGLAMVRYADDIVVLCRTSEEAAQALATIREWLEGAGLELHAGKTKIVDMAQAGAHFDFLGYRFWRGKAGKLRRFVRPKSRQKLRARIKPLTKRTNGQSLEAIVAKLNPILHGWYGYFRHASADALAEMDGWVRGRLRSILRKRRGGKGQGRGQDHHRWGNGYFAELGLFCLQAARAREWPVSRKEQTC
jgi:RNA-directed DNA polymerase